MCIFSLGIDQVTGTQIFASAAWKSQILVYSMQIMTQYDVAMILPLPVPPGSLGKEVRFINLQDYPEFFQHLALAFWEPPHDDGNSILMSLQSRGPLPVHHVGLFEASFVPSLDEFRWLDSRFRLPSQVWDQLPQYADWGFAVFKLKPGARPQDIHPMALEFPRRDPHQLFFPTVHVHDGQIHTRAEFNHTLYAQADRPPVRHRAEPVWSQSKSSLREYIDFARAAGIVTQDCPLYRREIMGMQPNQDTFLQLL